ncbi:probable RNA-binding protein 46 isoform X1 [Pogonomyrmex barbatus]|nr:probable RNA-binding protein 46 isoform X1 [Pogonomyrmex barbatus]XP_011641500.1 probable RNA-binding protein 46 isoform X1 [Pogonomyrmex barbatus]
MEGNKTRDNRKGNSRRRGGRKEEKREFRKMKNTRSEEVAQWPQFPMTDVENIAGIMQQETSLNLENFENGGENNSKSSLMCPALRRQLETHRNVLRLLHEYKLASTQINGQRILSIQPFRWSGPTPGIECEIFVGRIPKTIYEDTLYPLFKMVGEVFQIRLMVDMAELTRGYCFIMYTNPEDAARAITELDQYEISPGRKIRVLASVNKCKLYIGPLPWHIASEEVVRVIYASAWDIEYVSIYRFPNYNAAYAIVSFKSHRNAALARRKLRPERLFKCNDVHVEWARVDWNPSNVYEDRGTVDDKGDVQITRKYLQQSKKGTSSPSSIPSTQNDLNQGNRKQMPPICPPNDGNDHCQDADLPIVKSTNHRCNITRYSTMAMSVMNNCLLDDEKKSPMVITDINDNVQSSLDGHFQDKGLQLKKDANGFPNFDMWKSNLPTLPNSPTNSSGPKVYESLKKMPNESPRDFENSTELITDQPPQTSFFRYQCPNDSNASNYSSSDCSTSKMAEKNRPVAAVRYQNHSATPCYVLLQPPVYLYSSKDVITYSQSPVIPSRDDYDRPYWCNEQIIQGSMDSSPIQVGSEKLGDCELWHKTILPKAENGDAMSHLMNPATSYYVQNYAPNVVLNFTPICNPSESVSSCLVPLDVTNNNDEKRPRPILKQAIARVKL